MSQLNILKANFETLKSVNLPADFTAESVNVPVVHQVVKSILASRRQGTASTKVKSEVSGGGKKPFKQKGTGNARQGSTRSPLMPGGGTVFGPKPRDYDQKVNKKAMLGAIKSVLIDKYLAGKLFVVEKVETNGKTSSVYKLLESKSLLSSLIVYSGDNLNLQRATSNLKTSRSLPVESLSVYEAVKFENLVIEKAAFEKLTNKLV